MIVDSHCHLDHFTPEEQPQIIARAEAAGVTRMVTIGTHLEQAAVVKQITERFPGVWGTVGVHPQRAHQGAMPSVEELVALTKHPRIIGLGESGLDYFYDTAPHDVQQESFRRHIRAARLAGLPLCIHARDADADVDRLLREEAEAGPFAFLLHCFSSTDALAEAAMALGGYVSFSGILTFPKSVALRALAARLPPDRLLVETDAPYLAPVPVRGKRGEPGFTAHTLRALATVRGVAADEMAAATTANFFRLYAKAGGP